MTTTNVLPYDIFCKLASHIDVTDFAKLSESNNELHFLLSENSIWKKKLALDFGMSAQTISQLQPSSYSEIYKTLYCGFIKMLIPIAFEYQKDEYHLFSNSRRTSLDIVRETQQIVPDIWIVNPKIWNHLKDRTLSTLYRFAGFIVVLRPSSKKSLTRQVYSGNAKVIYAGQIRELLTNLAEKGYGEIDSSNNFFNELENYGLIRTVSEF